MSRPLFIVAAAATLAPLMAAPLAIVHEGESAYKILVASAPRGGHTHELLLTPSFAAKELRAYLKKIAGAELLMPLKQAHGCHMGQSADAALDEIALFDRPLTSDEVKALFESRTPLRP